VEAARAGCDVGVAFVGVDGFKHVNDALGHASGDRLLVEVGRRLALGVRPGDTVARFGGDEFVLVCEDITLTAMWGLAERVTEILAERFPVSGTDVALHASVGITISRVGSTNQSLLSEADAALYQAKEQGAGQIALFDDSLRTRAASILEGERALSAAIESGEIVAYYQPIVELGEGRTVGFEALARWQRPDGGLVLPDDFIPLAESTGLIVKLGMAILTQATAYAAARRAAESTGPPLWVSVNLSARQLIDVHLPDDVAAILDANGLDPSLLHLEITETVLMQNLTDAVLVLARLRDLGVRLSIDDFGTGYSSLAYLKQLPVDCLKIDRSFVADLGVGDHSIIKAILGLSEALGMDCIAEGIETEAQRRTLSDLGCRFGQGYLWQRPMPEIVAGTWSRAGG
jgi:diguanylate cyclase (GGDEF)-like protein